MRTLTELYPNTPAVSLKDIKTNINEVKEGDLFVSLDKNISEEQIKQVIKKGAHAIITSNNKLTASIPILYIENVRNELPYLSSKFYNYPEKNLKVMAITGEDGKSTVGKIIQILIGHDTCGYMEKNYSSCSFFQQENKEDISENVPLFYKTLDDFIKYECNYVVVENSTFMQNVLQPVSFDCGIYLNGENNTIYESIKKIKPDGIAILNKDDPAFEKIKSYYTGKVLTYGHGSCDLEIVKVTLFSNKTELTIQYEGKIYDITSPFLGDFNVTNLCASLLSCLAMGFEMDFLLSKIKSLKIEGHLEILKTQTDYKIMIDKANRPNRVLKLLTFIQKLNFNHMIVVIGVKEELDPSLRMMLGKIVIENANYVIFTEDDTESIDSNDLTKELTYDIPEEKNYEVILNRKDAIKKAIALAEKNDILLILGRGNETYLKRKKQYIYFNDIEEAYRASLDTVSSEIDVI